MRLTLQTHAASKKEKHIIDHILSNKATIAQASTQEKIDPRKTDYEHRKQSGQNLLTQAEKQDSSLNCSSPSILAFPLPPGAILVHC
jgi:glutamate racemase